MNKNILFNELLIMGIHEEKNEIISNTCLISDEPLLDNHIKLLCGHSFNYEYLLNEIFQQKSKTSGRSCHLRRDQIQCPYCRRKQTGIMPYSEGFPKYKYVNWPMNLSFIKNKCQYVFKRGKNKGKLCNKICTSTFCKAHSKYNVQNKEFSNQKLSYNSRYIYAKCEHILKRGNNKGQCCDKRVIVCKLKSGEKVDNNVLNSHKCKHYYCKNHQKKYGPLEKINQ